VRRASPPRRALAILLALLASVPAFAGPDESPSDAERLQVEILREEIASELQLQASDLVDELIYGWTQQPPFSEPTPVVLADVSVPVGFGSGLQALLENHVASVLLKNARSSVVPVHCPMCSAVVIHSGAKGTVIARGVDAPETLAEAGGLSGSRHALFLDFEAEGSALVLRARITSLERSLPIVFARTLSTSTSSPALLRAPDRLKSAAEARQEYLDVLRGRGPITFLTRVGVRSYAASGAEVAPPAFPWISVGVEAGLSQARAWTASFMVGGNWLPGLGYGLMGQVRLSRLLTGDVASLTRPDLYAFVGGAALSISGNSALVFGSRVPTLEDLAAQVSGREPHTAFGTVQVGLELRAKNRVGVGVFLEWLPTVTNAAMIGDYLNLGLVRFKSLGMEIAFCF
jgi:hypothetical protein